MNPLILNYIEESVKEDFDLSSIEYCEELNLSVIKETRQPAIAYLNLSTETFTKNASETADSDYNPVGEIMGTMTQTHHQMEGSDSDPGFSSIELLMATKTLTEAKEDSDSDI